MNKQIPDKELVLVKSTKYNRRIIMITAGASEREGGVGLGLSLVRQIARRHGGDVACVARSEPGSCFNVNLPT